jgi:tellurite methyltransferase
MIHADVLAVLGRTDIYLIDQIMKGRYPAGVVLLDAGCGSGRNLHWFLRNGFEIYGIDADTGVIQELIRQNPSLPLERFRVNAVEDLSFKKHFFDGIISSAVLHFAKNTDHFFLMMDEMYRVLKPGGNLFIRMTSDIGIENRVQSLGNGVYLIPDGSRRFLLTRSLLDQVMKRYSFSFLEDFKTVNVHDIRCMSTLVLQKEQA